MGGWVDGWMGLKTLGHLFLFRPLLRSRLFSLCGVGVWSFFPAHTPLFYFPPLPPPPPPPSERKTSHSTNRPTVRDPSHSTHPPTRLLL